MCAVRHNPPGPMDSSLTRLQAFDTPCYVYDTRLLAHTLDAIRAEVSDCPNYHVHYAIKANSNPQILQQIAAAGLGADCVSGGEIRAALAAGFPAAAIAFAGVGVHNQHRCVGGSGIINGIYGNFFHAFLQTAVY